MKKINITVGRFQPFTQGHLNMVNDGGGQCIVYQIIPNGIPESLASFKVKGRKVSKKNVENAIRKLNNEPVELSDIEKEIIKRPFTNELIKKEFDIIKPLNKNIKDVVYIKSMFDAFIHFSKFINEHADEYEPQWLLCGDDRKEQYDSTIARIKSNDANTDVDAKVIGKLQTYIGSGRTKGVSGTAVRESIITNDKAAFERIMPRGTGVMFDEFVDAFTQYKDRLASIVKESRTTLKDFIIESIKNI